MNRKLLFRVWDNIKKQYCSNQSIWRLKVDESGTGEITPPAIYFQQHPEGLSIQQWTGNFDLNGKEIYEGDIVTYSEGVELGDSQQLIGVVIYDEYMASFGFAPNLGSDCWNYFWEGVVKGIKVIGNINENPELLKDK